MSSKIHHPHHPLTSAHARLVYAHPWNEFSSGSSNTEKSASKSVYWLAAAAPKEFCTPAFTRRAVVCGRLRFAGAAGAKSLVASSAAPLDARALHLPGEVCSAAERPVVYQNGELPPVLPLHARSTTAARPPYYFIITRLPATQNNSLRRMQSPGRDSLA